MPKQKLAKIIAGLGVTAIIGVAGFVGTHEKLDDQWITNKDYKEIVNTLIKKQESGAISWDEYLLLIDIYDKETKKNKFEYKNLKTNKFVEKLNKKIKDKNKK